jgi:hypothetical protein
MSIKHTYEFIKSEFEREGYTLLSEEYKDCKTKLNYICPDWHKHSITWNGWRTGYRCPHCHGNAKPTLEQVRELFEKENYVLLSKDYINSYTKLYYKCPKNHEHSIKWSCWVSGRRCPFCAWDNIKLTLEQASKSFEKEGYTLLSKEYINAKTKLEYICSKGHEHSIRWNEWQKEHRCPTCASVKHSIYISGSTHPNWQGGISYEPYCPIWKDKEYKNDIKARDGYKCLNPCCSNKDKVLSIHHIDYNKKNCHPKNLITVCRSCNAKANTEREWHTIWYRALLYRRYNYEYY